MATFLLFLSFSRGSAKQELHEMKNNNPAGVTVSAAGSAKEGRWTSARPSLSVQNITRVGNVLEN